PSAYLHRMLPPTSSAICTSIEISGSLLAARQRSFETPPLSFTAFCRPPPSDLAISRKKRNASSMFDLPDAFGPTTNIRSLKGSFTARKLRQFLSSRRETIIDDPLVGTSNHAQLHAITK